MTEVERDFDEQLTVFSSECRDAVRYMSTLYAVHALIHEDRSLVTALQRTPIVWNAVIDALEQSVVLTLGRIFDPNQQNYNITRLVNHAQSNLSIFSPEALQSRMLEQNFLSAAQIKAKVLAAHTPGQSDFIEIRKSLAIHKRAYEDDLRNARHKFFAHRVLADHSQKAAIDGGEEVNRLRDTVTFLERLRIGLNGLFFSGEPLLGPMDYAVMGPRSTNQAVVDQVRLILQSLRSS